MRPIDFPESTVTLAKDQPQYLPLPVHVSYDSEMQMTSCWKLTWKERLKLLFTGRIWLAQLTFQSPLHPQLLMVDKPRFTRRDEASPLD